MNGRNIYLWITCLYFNVQNGVLLYWTWYAHKVHTIYRCVCIFQLTNNKMCVNIFETYLSSPNLLLLLNERITKEEQEKKETEKRE